MPWGRFMHILADPQFDIQGFVTELSPKEKITLEKMLEAQEVETDRQEQERLEAKARRADVDLMNMTWSQLKEKLVEPDVENSKFYVSLVQTLTNYSDLEITSR